MREIRLSGLMSGDGKRSVLLGAQPPRPSSTLPKIKAVYTILNSNNCILLDLVVEPQPHTWGGSVIQEAALCRARSNALIANFRRDSARRS
jgi:hypothetical protein